MRRRRHNGKRLVVLAAFLAAFAWPSVAHATTCVHNGIGNTLIVTIGSGQTATIARGVGGFTVNGTPCTSPVTITTIQVTGSGGTQRLVLHLPLQLAGPGGHIDYTVDLGTGSSDSIRVDGTNAVDHMVLGTSGMNFDRNTDSGLDIGSIVGVEEITFNGGAGSDVLSGDGGFFTGGATSRPISFIDGSGDDTLIGGGASDAFVRGSGNDSYDGKAGSDTLDTSAATSGVSANLSVASPVVNTGGLGTDHLASIENLTGSPFVDEFTGSGAANTFLGGGGNDFLSGRAGVDTLHGDAGVDFVDYGSETGGVTVTLPFGPVTAPGGNDQIRSIEMVGGSFHDDVLIGSAAAEQLFGRSGNDLLRGRGGDDHLSGDLGTDTLDYSTATGAVTVDLTTGHASGSDGNDTLAQAEKIVGGPGADTLTGDGGPNTLDGGPGADTLDGRLGDDTLLGGSGSFADTASYSSAVFTFPVTVDLNTGTVTSGGGNDHLTSIENVTGTGHPDTLIGDNGPNRLDGGFGNDTVDGRGGADTLIGGTDIFKDTVTYQAAPSPVSVDLTIGTATGGGGGDFLSEFENVTGSSFDDHLTGDDNRNELVGGPGNDILSGLGGHDFFRPEPGLDTFDGGAGTDTLSFQAETTPANVDLVAGTATSASGPDSVTGIENVTGSSGNDTLAGDDGPNNLDGSEGNDLLLGQGGNDELRASGNSVLRGGTGNDALLAVSSNQLLEGGPGDDVLDGTGSNSIATYANAPGPVVVDLGAGTATGDGSDTLTQIGGVVGSAFGDSLTAGPDHVTLSGLGGNDTLHGGPSGDFVVGGAGNDSMDGGGGADDVDFQSAPGPVTVRLDLGTATGDGSDTLSNIEGVVGSPFADVIIGSAGVDFVDGRAGGDLILGNQGNDQLDGGEGSDTIRGDAGADDLDGGVDAANDDHDTLDYQGAVNGLTVNLGSSSVVTATGTDTISGFENANGTSFADILTGTAVANVLTGFGGNDTLSGLAGDDKLNGGDGNDSLDGGADTDTCNQNAGTGTRTGCELGT